jgi:hypothetical protein
MAWRRGMGWYVPPDPNQTHEIRSRLRRVGKQCWTLDLDSTVEILIRLGQLGTARSEIKAWDYKAEAIRVRSNPVRPLRSHGLDSVKTQFDRSHSQTIPRLVYKRSPDRDPKAPRHPCPSPIPTARRQINDPRWLLPGPNPSRISRSLGPSPIFPIERSERWRPSSPRRRARRRNHDRSIGSLIRELTGATRTWDDGAWDERALTTRYARRSTVHGGGRHCGESKRWRGIDRSLWPPTPNWGSPQHSSVPEKLPGRLLGRDKGVPSSNGGRAPFLPTGWRALRPVGFLCPLDIDRMAGPWQWILYAQGRWDSDPDFPSSQILEGQRHPRIARGLLVLPPSRGRTWHGGPTQQRRQIVLVVDLQVSWLNSVTSW